jgi:hypothetical protein
MSARSRLALGTLLFRIDCNPTPLQDARATSPSGDIFLKESREFFRARRESRRPVANLIKLEIHDWIDQPARHDFSILTLEQTEGRNDRDTLTTLHNCPGCYRFGAQRP